MQVVYREKEARHRHLDERKQMRVGGICQSANGGFDDWR
jgi:hypothetical protein